MSNRGGSTQGVAAWLEHGLKLGDPRLIANAVRSLREQGHDVDNWQRLRIVLALARAGNADLASRAGARWIAGLELDARGMADVACALVEALDGDGSTGGLVPALLDAGRRDLADRLRATLDVDHLGMRRG